MAHDKKQLPQQEPSGASKTLPRATSVAFHHMNPKWSFAKCDFEFSRWGVSRNPKCVVAILRRFQAWEASSTTWGKILTVKSGRSHGTQNHAIPVCRLDPDVAKRLNELKLNEYDSLYSLSITGKQHAWGIMIEETGTFQLLWVDPNHEVYKVSR